MCQFFEKRGYPASVIQTAHHRAQQTDRQSALQTSQKEKNDRIPFTLTFHPHNNPVKAIILNNFKILQNDPETGAIFSQPPLISFKRDKNVGNFLVKSTFKTIEKPGTFKCARSRCKTCPFVQNADKISGTKRSVKITDRFTCTSANVIYCITCTLCKKLYIGETGRRLGDRCADHALVYAPTPLSMLYHALVYAFMKERVVKFKTKVVNFRSCKNIRNFRSWMNRYSGIT